MELAEIGVRLVDEAYLAWLCAARDCEQASRAWQEQGAAATGAYCAYRAALDREEAAARDLERLSELTRPCRHALKGEDQPPLSSPVRWNGTSSGMRSPGP